MHGSGGPAARLPHRRRHRCCAAQPPLCAAINQYCVQPCAAGCFSQRAANPGQSDAIAGAGTCAAGRALSREQSAPSESPPRAAPPVQASPAGFISAIVAPTPAQEPTAPAQAPGQEPTLAAAPTATTLPAPVAAATVPAPEPAAAPGGTLADIVRGTADLSSECLHWLPFAKQVPPSSRALWRCTALHVSRLRRRLQAPPCRPVPCTAAFAAAVDAAGLWGELQDPSAQLTVFAPKCGAVLCRAVLCCAASASCML